MFNTVKELIEDIRQGKMVILLDDEDRENEGDLVMAAEKVRPQDINFMVTYGRGLVCMPITQARCQQIGLPLMVPSSEQTTRFTVSIEAREGVTTGISAEDRARTVQVAVAKDAKAHDLVQPGHIFPIMAQPGGVLTRAGHTEASTDLVRFAGMEPAAVIVEVLKDDGTMARRDDLLQMAKKHNLKIGTIADIIRYRIEHEQTIECVAKFDIDTHFGDFQVHAMLDKLEGEVHFALIKGDISPDKPVNVRVHYRDDLNDLFAIKGTEKSWGLHQAMEYIQQEGSGVIVTLSHPQSSEDILSQLLSRPKQKDKESFDTKEYDNSLKMIGTGARILRQLGVRKMRVLSPPKTYHALSGFGLEVVDYFYQ